MRLLLICIFIKLVSSVDFMHSYILCLDFPNIASLSLLVSLYYIQRTHHAWEALMQSLPWCDRSHTLGGRMVWGWCMLCVVPPPLHHTIEVVVSNVEKWAIGKRDFLTDHSRHFSSSKETEPHWCEHLKACSKPVWWRFLVGQMWRPRYTFTHFCRSGLWNPQRRRRMCFKYLHIFVDQLWNPH